MKGARARPGGADGLPPICSGSESGRVGWIAELVRQRKAVDERICFPCVMDAAHGGSMRSSAAGKAAVKRIAELATRLPPTARSDTFGLSRWVSRLTARLTHQAGPRHLPSVRAANRPLSGLGQWPGAGRHSEGIELSGRPSPKPSGSGTTTGQNGRVVGRPDLVRIKIEWSDPAALSACIAP